MAQKIGEAFRNRTRKLERFEGAWVSELEFGGVKEISLERDAGAGFGANFSGRAIERVTNDGMAD